MKLPKLTDRELYLACCKQRARDMERHSELFRLIRDDLKMRADDNGVVNISDFIWQKINDELEDAE